MDTCNAPHIFQRITLKGKNSISKNCILCNTNYIIFFFFKFYLFILCCAGSSLLLGLFSSCRAEATLQLQFTGFSLQWLFFLWITGSRACKLQQLWLPGYRALAQYLWCMGLVPLWHMGSCWIRDRTCVPCIGRQILYYYAPREALYNILDMKKLQR